MPLQTHFVGLDVVFEDNFALKILEIQNMFSSQVSSAKQVTGKDPKERLVRVIAKQNPDIDIPTPFEILSKAKKASLMGNENNIPNRGVEAILQMKYLFYLFCQQNQDEMGQYIPKTEILTAQTLACSEMLLSNSPVLLKPADGSRGNGIALLDSSAKRTSPYRYIKQQNANFLQNFSKIPDTVLDSYPLVLQEYLANSNQSNECCAKPVFRIYAAVTIDDDGKIAIAVDLDSAYVRKRKNADTENYRVENNTRERCNWNPEQKILVKHNVSIFLKTFFSTLLTNSQPGASQNLISYRCWEKLLSDYIEHYSKLNHQKRLNLISIFSLVLHQEQRFTSNRLSQNQFEKLCCFILFFKTKINDYNASVLIFLTHAIGAVMMHNFSPYINEEQTQNFIRAYYNMINDIAHESTKNECLGYFCNVYREICRSAHIQPKDLTVAVKHSVQEKEQQERQLRSAAGQGKLDTIRSLLVQYPNIDLNSKGLDTGKTALHKAVEANHQHVVEFLLENNVDISIQDNLGNSSLDYAQNNQELLDLLAAVGMSFQVRGI